MYQGVNILTKQIKHFADAVQEESHCSLNHLAVFAQICKTQPVTLHDLQQSLGYHKSTTCRLVHALSNFHRGKRTPAELVDVETMMSDRRHRLIRLTLKGKALMDKMFLEHE
tara:strand:+ start:331 stop:666 length:336 start_codon:yes stop_codon:yes gene_type:complete